MKEDIFVAREDELQRLRQRLDRALAGEGQVQFVVGQAGSGKTALVGRFAAEALAAHPDLVLLMGSCNAQTGIGDPYLPFREALNMLTGEAAGGPAQAVAPDNAQRLRTLLARSVQVLVEVAPELVGLFVPGAKLLGALGKAVADKVGWMDALEDLAEREPAAAHIVEQRRLLEQYTAFIQRLSAEAPLLLFVDDLQWADSASVNLLFHLARRIDTSRVLILGAYRPSDVALGRGGERHPLMPVVHELARSYGEIYVDLDGLPTETNRQFLDELLDSEPNTLGEGFREALFRQTGGHALFVVELIREMQARGDLVQDDAGRWSESPTLDWEGLPARVEGVIAERIARLDALSQEMLTVASVQGEEFAAEVIAQIQAVSGREAIRLLSSELARRHRLVNAVGLVHHGTLRLSLYRFAHSLFQHYLYDHLAEAERIYLHHDLGVLLETLFAGQTGEIAAQLARHFEAAGVAHKAAQYRLEAGQRARRLSADQEAAQHLRQGLAQAAALPMGPERMQLELGLQTALGTTLMATHGYASPHVEEALTQARELARALGDPPEATHVLFGLLSFYLTRAEMERAFEEGERLLEIAQRAGHEGYVLSVHAVLGATATYQGRYGVARQHLDQTVALYNRQRHANLTAYQSQDPAVAALAYRCWVNWFEGYAERAVADSAAALTLAREIEHPYSQVFAGTFAAGLEGWLRRWPESQALAEETIALAQAKGFGPLLANTLIIHGQALAHQGHREEGIAEIQEGLAMWEATGASIALPAGRARLAQAYLLAGRQGEGLAALEGSLCCPEQACWLPEQHRIHAGLLLLAPDAGTEAEASLREAIQIAKAQGARAFQLRAASDLARLLQSQGRFSRAREELSEACAAFEDGLEVPDLREARELLAELGRSERAAIREPLAVEEAVRLREPA